MQTACKQLCNRIVRDSIKSVTLSRLVSVSACYLKTVPGWGSTKKKHLVAKDTMDPAIEEKLQPFRESVKEQVCILLSFSHWDNIW